MPLRRRPAERDPTTGPADGAPAGDGVSPHDARGRAAESRVAVSTAEDRCFVHSDCVRRRPGRWIKPFVGVPVALAIMSTLGAGTVRADNTLESSEPADGSTLEAAPSEVVLRFVDPVDPATVTIELVAADESSTALPNPAQGADDRSVRAALPSGLSGLTTVRWKMVATDGHVMSGRFTFTVGSGAGSTTSTVGPGGDEGPGGIVDESPGGPTYGQSTPEVVRWMNRLAGYLALIAVGGLVVAEMFFASGVLHQRRAETVIRVGAAALVISPLVQTLSFVGDVRGTGFIAAIPHVFGAFDTTPGSMMLMRTVIGGVLAYLLLIALPRDGSRTLSMMVLGCGGLYLFTLAYAGHSRSKGAPWLGVPLDVAHTAAAVAWLGGLVALLVVALPGADGARAAVMFQRFSGVARLSVMVIVGTGIVQALRLHTGILTLVTTTHGRLLVLKIALVVGMLRIADLNRRRLERRRGPEPRATVSPRLVRASLTEAAVGALVVAVTAALVTSSF